MSDKLPKLSDYYDETDPRGCSSSEYAEYERALKKYNEKTSGRSNKTQ